jgi:hypothetical protein
MSNPWIGLALKWIGSWQPNVFAFPPGSRLRPVRVQAGGVNSCYASLTRAETRGISEATASEMCVRRCARRISVGRLVRIPSRLLFFSTHAHGCSTPLRSKKYPAQPDLAIPVPFSSSQPWRRRAQQRQAHAAGAGSYSLFLHPTSPPVLAVGQPLLGRRVRPHPA